MATAQRRTTKIDHLTNLPPEVKVQIARKDASAFAGLIRVDDEFNNLMMDNPKLFTELKTLHTVVRTKHEGRTIRKTTYTLFGKYHREDDQPAIVFSMKVGNEWKKYQEIWYQHGWRQREGGKPAFLSYSSGSNIFDKPTEKRWYLNGKLHRIGAPAEIQYTSNGDPRFESWYFNGKLHRIGGAAEIAYQDGSVNGETWYVNGKEHRVGGPSSILYYADSTVETSDWVQNGKPFREDDQPTTVNYRENGTIESARWEIAEGKFHRVDGPAIIDYNEDGSVRSEQWYTNGVTTRKCENLRRPTS